MAPAEFESLERSGRSISLLSLGSILAVVSATELNKTSGEIFGIPASLLPELSVLLCASAVFLSLQLLVNFGYIQSSIRRKSLDDAETESIEMLSANTPEERTDDENVAAIEQELESIQARLSAAEKRFSAFSHRRKILTIYPPLFLCIAACLTLYFSYYPGR